MRKIKVLYSFPLRLGTSGIGMTGFHQVSGLVKKGVRISLFCGSCERPIQGLDYVKEIFKFGPVKLPIRILGVNKAKMLHDTIVARCLRRIRGEVDIIHCWPSAAKETLKTARELGIKTVLERPNTHTRYAFEVVRQEYEKLGLKMIKHHSHMYDVGRLHREEEEFDLTDRLLCPSEFVAKTFLDLGFKQEKIAFHQYGFDPERFDFSEYRGKELNQPFNIVFLGSCEPRKGLHYALKAWLDSAACNKGRFYICGRFIPGYRELLADMLAHPSIREIGYLDDVTTILGKCHALILPSIEEGSALVSYEARACGCVLLVSEATGARCVHMQNGLVHNVGDVTSLREHIDLLASDRDLFLRLQNESLAGLRQLTWLNAAETLVNIYRECLV